MAKTKTASRRMSAKRIKQIQAIIDRLNHHRANPPDQTVMLYDGVMAPLNKIPGYEPEPDPCAVIMQELLDEVKRWTRH